MSTDRLPFNLNSLIPETCKTKAEAFAKCLQHKLLSLKRDTSSEPTTDESIKRLNPEERLKTNNFLPETSEHTPNDRNSRIGHEKEQSKWRVDKTDDSDEEFFSHSESDTSDLSDTRRRKGKPILVSKQKLTSMSSEDSTVESWGSCQENLTDFERLDSENEELNCFVSQIKGSPKLKNLKIRCKRKEMRDKSWKKNCKKNHSSSTESVDSEARVSRHREALDPESHTNYIFLHDLEDDEIPHRILRESSSTSSLERHFSESFEEMSSLKTRQPNKQENEKTIDQKLTENGKTEEEDKFVTNEVQKSENVEEDSSRLKFAEEEGVEGIEFDEVGYMKDFSTNESSTSVKVVNGVVRECQSENQKPEMVVFGDYEDLTISEVEVREGEFEFREGNVEVVQEGSVEELQKNDVENVQEGSVKLLQGSDVEVAQEGGVEVLQEADVEVRSNNQDQNQISSHLQPTHTDEEMLDDTGKLRRCSSLKTWKTPPGTPGAKKIVRFADALGLDLTDVRTFLDEIPKIPSSAYEDLRFEAPPDTEPPSATIPTLIPLFQQPASKTDFLEKVQLQKICLESASVTDTSVLTVSGCVRVQNMSFHKSVFVRYSLNNWKTFSDLQATYVPNSCDGFFDKFSFSLFGHTLSIGERLEFALRLECCGSQYWDNNGGINYVFNCLPLTSANTFFSSLGKTGAEPWNDFNDGFNFL